MLNIITQDGCWNCQSVMIPQDIESGYIEWPYWWCNYYKDYPEEIATGGGLAWVYADGLDDDESIRRHQLLCQWEKIREVKSYQKCDCWRRKNGI